MRQVFLDTETTGLSPETGDRIVEIGCIELVSRRFTQNNRHYYLNPDRASSPEALKVHGLTESFLSGQPRFADIADELMTFLEGAEVIIHNAAFDVNFLDHELKRMGRAPFARHVTKVTDSLLMAREIYPGKANSLDALCRRLEVDNSSRTLHGALLDAGLLAEVFLRMTRGQDALVIDESQNQASMAQASGPSVLTDLSTLEILVLEPTDAEREAHGRVLSELDKASSGKTAWRRLVS